MKFQTQQTDLIQALNCLVRNTDAKIPAYSNILIEKHSNDVIKLKATNGTVAIQFKIKALNVEGESVILNAKKLHEIVSRLKGSVTFNDGLITCGTSKIKIEKRDIFAEFDELEAETTQIDLDEFRNGIKNRLFACEKGQGVLSGVCINKDSIAATDGNVLSCVDLGSNLPINNEIIIDSKLAFELTKCFDNGNVEFCIDKCRIMFKNDDVFITSLLIDGQYPRYQQLIPTPSHTVIINKNELIEKLELLGVTVNEHPTVALTFTADKLTIQTANGSDELDIEYNDEEMKIAFNINFLLNVLKNIDSEVIDFGFSEPLRACLISAGNEKNIIMPIQLR